MNRETTPTVDAIGKIHLEGNVVPHTWYSLVKMDNGKPDLNGIVILAEIVYWYRPSVKLNPDTMLVESVTKKFDDDKWQKTSVALAKKFGLSKRQVTDALARLEKACLITREFRNFRSKSGLPLSNVQYIEPVPENIDRISNGHPPITQCPSNQLPDAEQQNTQGQVNERTTYTEIITNIPTEIPNKESSAQNALQSQEFPSHSASLHPSTTSQDEIIAYEYAKDNTASTHTVKDTAPSKQGSRTSKSTTSAACKQDNALYPLAHSLAVVCGDVAKFENKKDKKTRGRYFSAAKDLSLQSCPTATPELIGDKFGTGKWYWLEDWRGQKGEYPNPQLIVDLWGDWMRPKIIPFSRGSGNMASGVVPIADALPTDGEYRRADFSDYKWRRLNPLVRRGVIATETGRDLCDVKDDTDYGCAEAREAAR